MQSVVASLVSLISNLLEREREREREDAAVKTKGAKVTVRQRKVVVWN